MNLIRAKICELPEESEFTSVCDRIKARVSKEKADAIQQIEKTKGEITEAQKILLLLEADQAEKASWLGSFSPIKNRKNDNRQYFYHITETDYLELID